MKVKEPSPPSAERTPLKPCNDNVMERSAKGSKKNMERSVEKTFSSQIYRDTRDVIVQATIPESDEVTAEDLMSENPSRAYWKQTAMNRLKSLEEALEENHQLKEKVSLMQDVIDNCEDLMLTLKDILMSVDEDPEPAINMLESINKLKEAKKVTEASSSVLSEAYFSGEED